MIDWNLVLTIGVGIGVGYLIKITIDILAGVISGLLR